MEAADRLLENSPEDFGRFIAKILHKLGQSDPIAHGYMISAISTNQLRSGGVFVALEQTKQALGDQQWDRAIERVTAIVQWFRELEYLGSQERVKALLLEEESADEPAPTPRTYVM